MTPLVMFGAGHGFALKTLHAINAESPTWDLLGFVDDDPAKAGSELLGYPVLGDRSVLPKLLSANADLHVFNNVVGHWSKRRDVAELLADGGFEIASLIDPRIDVLDLHCGVGVFIGAFANFGHSARLGDYAVIMQAVVLGDETEIGDYVFIANLANVGSRAVVGENTFVGPNSVVLLDRIVGPEAVVGAGAIIVSDVPAGAKMFSPPAQRR
ncbi:MAG: hypothetical protein V3V01_18855 [Acidimicrobiales bacterium]